MLDPLLERVPPRERLRLPVVEVDVDGASVRPRLLEKPRNLRLETAGSQRAVAPVVVEKERELQGSRHDECRCEDTRPACAPGRFPQRCDRGDRDHDEHHRKRRQTNRVEPVDRDRSGHDRDRERGHRKTPERVVAMPHEDDHEAREREYWLTNTSVGIVFGSYT